MGGGMECWQCSQLPERFIWYISLNLARLGHKAYAPRPSRVGASLASLALSDVLTEFVVVVWRSAHASTSVTLRRAHLLARAEDRR